MGVEREHKRDEDNKQSITEGLNINAIQRGRRNMKERCFKRN